MKFFVDVAYSDVIFTFVQFFLGDAVAYVCLEIFLCFLQQFDRLAMYLEIELYVYSLILCALWHHVIQT